MSYPFSDKLRTVSHGLFVTMSTISCVGIVIAIGLLVFNTVYRDQKFVTIGCVLHDINR